MQYKKALFKLLNGIRTDNAPEIESACRDFLTLLSFEPLTKSERELAALLTQRAVDDGYGSDLPA